MDDLPITRPVTPINDQRPGGSTGQFARRLTKRRDALAAGDTTDDDEGSGEHQPHPMTPMADPARPLLEALDRLLVTNELRPADLEFARTLRGIKAYRDPITAMHALPPPRG